MTTISMATSTLNNREEKDLELVEDFLQRREAQGKAPATIHGDRIAMSCLLAWLHQRGYSVKDVTFTMLEEYQSNFLEDGGRKESTWNIFMSKYGRFFAYLEHRDIIRKNPVDSTFYIKTASRKKKIALTPKDIDLILLEAAKRGKKYLILVDLMVECGLRVSEALSLSVGNFYYTLEGVPLLKVIGKGNKERSIELPQGLANYIAEYIKGKGINDPLFPSPHQNRAYITPDAVRKMLDKMLKDIGLVGVSPHDLRAYYASSLIRDGVDLHTVQLLMGHVSPITTTQYFRALDTDVIGHTPSNLLGGMYENTEHAGD